MTSPLLRVESCCQIPTIAFGRMYGTWVTGLIARFGLHSVRELKGHELIELLMNLTEPSPKVQLTPPW